MTTISTTTPAPNLPGLDLPLDHYANGARDDLFPTPLDSGKLNDGYCNLPIQTLRELTMQHIMNQITDKPGWEIKVFDDAIAEKWKAESIAMPEKDITTSMMDYVIEELRWKAGIFKKSGTVTVYNGDVVKSDNAIPRELKEAFKAGAKVLEDVSDKKKDYHPGSDNQVLDLVHPSLFPLIYGRSRILNDRVIGVEDAIDNIGKGETIRSQDEFKEDQTGVPSWNRRAHEQSPYSKNYQWLPCEVAVEDGQARVTSYINNLHPEKHQALYTAIGEIITKTLPLWNLTLAGLKYRRRDTRINYELSFDPDPEDIDDADKPPQEDGESEDDYWERMEEWADDIRRAVPCDPGKFFAPGDDNYEGTEFLFLKKGMQVIVKLANIELTPEKPQYAGGTWHVEGQLNEHICTTALYYYDNHNISESHLSFRQHVADGGMQEMNYPQNVHGWLDEIFGVSQDGPCVQDVGSIVCREDRLLTFPNILQHQVQPFHLSDPSKPGHRKILALFLIDPNTKIISTAHVPPQQKEWWTQNLYNKAFQEMGNRLGELSNELKDKVLGEVGDFPIEMDEAKEIRLKLMEERKEFKLREGRNFESMTFSLCEH